MVTTVVCGNPKAGSRTLTAAVAVAEALTGQPDDVIDVAELGPGLLGWGDPATATAVETMASSDVLVVASPTYKATYTGLLKLLLDQVPTDGLAGVLAVPVMVGAGPRHALAPELLLRPVLVELGASCPLSSLYLLDSALDEELEPTWLDRGRRIVTAYAGARVRA